MRYSEKNWSEEILRKYLDGQMSPEQAQRLEQDLIAQPELAYRLANLSRWETQIRIAQQSQTRESISFLIQEFQQIRSHRHPSIRFWIGGSLAVGFLIGMIGILIVYFSQDKETPPAPLELDSSLILATVIEGPIRVNGQLERSLKENQIFSTDNQTSATILFLDGSIVELAPNSSAQLSVETSLDRPVLKLLEGGGIFSIVPHEVPYVVRTPVGVITVLGTEFQVELRPVKEKENNMSIRQMLLVAVTSGMVSVNAGGITERLVAGQSALYGEEKPVRESVVTGTVKAIDLDKKAITLASKEGDGGRVLPEQSFALADGFKVTINGKPGKLDEIKPRMNVQLILGADRKNVTEIRTRISADSERPGRPLRGFRGSITKLDDKLITVSVGGDAGIRSETFPLEGVKIFLETSEDMILKGEGGREIRRPKTAEGKLGDLKTGQMVTLQIRADKLITITVAREVKREKGEKDRDK